MKILVTGANGQLGRSLQRVLNGADAPFQSETNIPSVAKNRADAPSGMSDSSFQGEVVYTDVEELDITDLAAVRAMVAREGIEAIVNCAAYTNVDAAEDNQALAELLNAKAVENLAVAMKEVDGLLVHISTDYVFGKEPYNTPCREDQQGTPTGVYGLTKLHGEQAILASGVRYVILRTAWLYSEYGKNFVKTMLQLTAEKPMLKVVFDQVGTPTYAGDLAAAIVTILGRPVPGIYHYSNEGVCSWYDFTKMIAEYAGHTACDIQPCHSDEFPSKVRRPSYSVLDKTKVKETFGLHIPYWTQSLKQCIANLI